MSIERITNQFRPIENIIKPADPKVAENGTTKKNSFSDVLGNAMKEVDGLQKEADKQIEGLVMGSDSVSPHGAMIALEKADMAFQMMNTIRSKIIRAYEEVIRTQV